MAGAGGEHDQQPRRGQVIEDSDQEIVGTLVDPVQVFEKENARGWARRCQQDLAQDLEGSLTKCLRGHAVGNRDIRPEPPAEDRRRLDVAVSQGTQPALDDGQYGVGLVGEVPRTAQEIVKQVVGNLGTVGGAATLEVTHAQGVQLPAELEKQTGFADTRLARDPDHLTKPAARAIKPLEEEPQLEVTAYEGAQAAPAKAEARRLRPHEMEAPILFQF